ncbi:putative transcriptional regulator [Marinitoga piezophila KA3]|uniref:Putative transcriptional regulator n=1 Tax=Marinitoga piezophila (strain DSM 14283 / JCM 11233 / KA3) TaxID=443254 RepID=H2J2N3_MARPK|nr:metalloregulator ArsR/SmtB family transcription factor [Marinitoga piezophila]AEX84477.1 putative transcriptional regulator [Marinitoga piezophila KA3]
MLEELMKILADKTRLRILNLLFYRPHCVCELTKILDLPQSTVSRHISKMRLIGIIMPKKMGTLTKYSINDKIANKFIFFNYLKHDLFNEYSEDIERSKEYVVLDNNCNL